MTVATTEGQLPKPSGANSGAILLPSAASIEASMLSTMTSEPFSIAKLLANQMRIAERRMIEPARLMKLQPRSQVLRSTLAAEGTWYAGSSITNGAGSPRNGRVFLRMMPLTMTAATPRK